MGSQTYVVSFGWRNHFLILVLWLSFLIPRVRLDANDYRLGDFKVSHDTYTEDAVVRLAFALGRATDAISKSSAAAMYDHLIGEPTPMPSDFANTWQKLLRVSASLLQIKVLEHYFAVGLEIETVHKTLSASAQFEKGAGEITNLIAGAFGLQEIKIEAEKAILKDDGGRKWSVVAEWAKRDEDAKGGWETVTPPFWNRDSLQNFASFVWKLGESDFGQSSFKSSIHQTFNLLPEEVEGDTFFMGRVVANFILLHEQFLPAIFEILEVKRWGAIENVFFRPILFDHSALLERVRTADPRAITLDDIWRLMFDEFIEAETLIQADNYFFHGDSRRETLLNSSKAEKAAFRGNWKYRDIKIRFDLERPARTVIESRLMDWVPGHPEQVIVGTLLYQLLLGKAYELAVGGNIWDLKLPYRQSYQSIIEYWEVLKRTPGTSVNDLLKVLGVEEADVAALFKKTKFQTITPKLKAHDRINFGFEMECTAEALVRLIVPKSPSLRKQWRRMSDSGRVSALEKMGFRFDGKYDLQWFRVLTSEFAFDIEKYPFMDPDLYLEASGNWEIKSNGRGIYDTKTLRSRIQTMAKAVDGAHFGLHIHQFVPELNISRLRSEKKVGKFIDFLERLSFYMNLADYASADTKKPGHWLDSWSLDRFSQRDLARIQGFLEGRADLDYWNQKYHNLAFRPVERGIDLEVRDIGNEVRYGIKISNLIQRAMEKRDFGEIEFEQDTPLFMEFREYSSPGETQKYTLEHAVSERYQLTPTQRSILHKLQFEIYKPAMADYMYFEDYYGITEVDPANMDVKYVRANFESNIAIPLQPYQGQSYFNPSDLSLILKSREQFLAGLYQLVGEIETDPKYTFLVREKNFLHLCDYLEKSTHPSKPDLHRVPEKSAYSQRKILEALTYRMRSLVVRFVGKTRLDEILYRSLTPTEIAPVESGPGMRAMAEAETTNQAENCAELIVRYGR